MTPMREAPQTPFNDMAEKEFSELVHSVIQHWVSEWMTSSENRSLPLQVFESVRPPIGKLAWWEDCHQDDVGGPAWKWVSFKRELDIVIGVSARFDDGSEETIPFTAIELKSARRFNTDELDKKSYIYDSLSDSYPWVQTIFLHRDLSERGMYYKSLLRNGRGFDYCFYEWDAHSASYIRRIIEAHLDYTVRYWELAHA